MKKFFKIFGLTVLIIAIILGGLMYWQRNNIKAIINGLKYSDEEIGNMVITAQEDLKKAVEEFSGTPLREYTEEEKELIESGQVTSDEIMAQIINEALEEKLAQSNIEAQKNVDNPKANAASGENNSNEKGIHDAPKTADTVINEHVAKLYSLKSSYMGKIDALMAEGAAEYYAAAKTQGASSARSSLLPKYMSRLTSLESSCDKEVEAIISSLTAELKARNHSLDIIKTIRASYANEKSLKIAQLISKYK